MGISMASIITPSNFHVFRLQYLTLNLGVSILTLTRCRRGSSGQQLQSFWVRPELWECQELFGEAEAGAEAEAVPEAEAWEHCVWHHTPCTRRCSRTPPGTAGMAPSRTSLWEPAYIPASGDLCRLVSGHLCSPVLELGDTAGRGLDDTSVWAPDYICSW